MIGYRIGYPEERVAWEALNFEYEDLGNEHILEDVSGFIKVKGDQPTVLKAFRQKYEGAEGIWLTRTKEDAIQHYNGRFSDYILVYKYNPDMVISDLGEDGFFVLNPSFSKEELFKK